MTILAKTAAFAAARPSALATLGFWIARQRQRRQLSRLDAHRLADIGVDAPAARREASKPLWQD